MARALAETGCYRASRGVQVHAVRQMPWQIPGRVFLRRDG